eukprot:CAMPEP_0114487872 /NCGR_PEP_ID=MMETSP0109-20121206/1008_1 /TAXON_ID=29199 /ORGANISM="Chlorarachnion reptans, Strain CCCM449" /LENGTH=78 /DNA_ID=CAMNT_0001664187 /DNA_START=1287 /DNA_END=1520 /DNA_ORIENTATION=+
MRKRDGLLIGVGLPNPKPLSETSSLPSWVMPGPLFLLLPMYISLVEAVAVCPTCCLAIRTQTASPCLERATAEEASRG